MLIEADFLDGLLCHYISSREQYLAPIESDDILRLPAYAEERLTAVVILWVSNGR